MKSMKLIPVLILATSLLAIPTAFARETGTGQTGVSHLHLAAAMPQSELQSALRGLWKGHADAVFAVATALAAKDDAAVATAEAAVVENAKMIAGAIEPFYGAAAKDGLFALLAEHYGAVKSYTVAALAKDENGTASATKAATENGEKIAVFLSGANPNLPKDAVFGLLAGHAGHHFTQADQLADGDAKAAKATQVDMIDHLNMIADTLAGALAKQFPDMIKA